MELSGFVKPILILIFFITGVVMWLLLPFGIIAAIFYGALGTINKDTKKKREYFKMAFLWGLASIVAYCIVTLVGYIYELYK